VAIELPFTNKPEDVVTLLQKLPATEVPEGSISTDYIKSLGFSAGSSEHLFDILKKLGFIDEQGYASDIWKSYVANDDRGLILARSIKNAYPDLFKLNMCPYLEADETLMDYLKNYVKTTPKNREYMLVTFRALSEPADWQDILGEEEPQEPVTAISAVETLPNVNVNPNRQISIQVHIDPNTPDDKIETIFKNMRKYLLGKE
jgi:hypothetical protein